MSANLVEAFNLIIGLQGRTMTFERNGGVDSDDIKVAPSSSFKTLPGLEETSIDSRQFVISKRELDSKTLPAPKRGDTLYDAVLSVNAITSVKELFILGALVGYRVDTQ